MFRPALLASLFAVTPALAQTFVAEGEVPDAGTFFYVPFEVPPGTAELEVRHDDLSSSNILDWGLLMPDGGFRGWGGGNSEPAVVGEFAASRSYRTGPLPSGTWQVLVGKAYVPQKPGKFRVEVDTRTQPTLARQSRTPYAPTPPLTTGGRWYQGDLHVHSRESGDARPSLDEIAAVAASRGLDFVAISDHNTVSQLDFFADAQVASPRVLLVPSVEFTTYAGHFGGFGATRFVPFWSGIDAPKVDEAMNAFVAQGAVVTINHPTLDLGTFCIGCAWQHPLTAGAQAIEVGVGGLDGTGALFDESAMVFWEQLADRGLHLAAVGGSDDHKAGRGSNQTQSPIGEPTTLIEADELSVDALASGLREARTVVKLRGPGDPMIVLAPPAGMVRTGDRLTADRATLTATVTAGSGFTLVWVENGVPAREESIDQDPFVSTFELVAPSGKSARVRAEVRLGAMPRTVTSHLWLSSDSPPGPPVVVARKSASGCLGCTSGGGSLGFALALACLARRKRAAR